LDDLKKDFKVIDIRGKALPAKQYFLPPKQKTFVFNKKTKKLSCPEYKKEFLVFGLGLADLEAMTQLDEIMEKPYSDFFYWQKRNKSLIIGLVDESIEVAPGGDVILEKITDQQYRALILTDKGKAIIKDEFFDKKDKPSIKNYPQPDNPFKRMLLDSELLAEAVKWSLNHKIWDKLGEQCLGCGICTYVCPLCHCFSIEDQVSLDNKECSRCRQWDACTLPEFSKVAGGHNFHKTIKQRYYNWFYHKFVRAYHEYGKSQCVACGRCRENCPAGIKISEVLKEIVDDYKKHLSAI
jgi:ferredoxin